MDLLKNGSVSEDKRPIAKRSSSKNKLTEEERSEIIEVANSFEFADLPPCQIVPRLADKGKYISLESNFYRILKEERMDAYRGRSKKLVKRPPILI